MFRAKLKCKMETRKKSYEKRILFGGTEIVLKESEALAFNFSNIPSSKEKKKSFLQKHASVKTSDRKI